MRLKLSRFRRNFNKDLPVEFTEQNLSSFGGLELFSRYLRHVELSRRVGKACRGKGIRSDYGSVRLVLVLVGMLLVGARRLEHLQYVCDDPMLLRFCGLRRVCGCLRCFLLVMCTHPFAKKALTLHLARSEGHERYFSCNLMHRKVLASSHQHLMAEAPNPYRLHSSLDYNSPMVFERTHDLKTAHAR